MSTMRNHPEKPSTYADLLQYPEGQRWELIEGTPCLQAAPSWQHQHLVRELITSMANYLKGKTCQVFSAPFDVMLSEENDADNAIKTVLQPDLVVVCEPSRLKNTGYHGAPKLVVEITSPSSARMDMLVKYRIYQQAKIPAYWIVQPEERNLLQYHLNKDGIYEMTNVMTEEDVLTDTEFPDMEIRIAGLFPPK